MTTSWCCFTLSKVCLVVLSLPLLDGEKTIIGGLALNTLKKLNGLKFTLPLVSIVLANAIGLGATAESKILCSSGVGNEFGSMVLIAIRYCFAGNILARTSPKPTRISPF